MVAEITSVAKMEALVEVQADKKVLAVVRGIIEGMLLSRLNQGTLVLMGTVIMGGQIVATRMVAKRTMGRLAAAVLVVLLLLPVLGVQERI